MPEGLDKESVSDKMLQKENNGELVVDKNAIMCGCGNSLDLMERCVVAGCDSCVKNVESNNHQCAKICKCRGRRISMPAKELADKIEKDWNLEEVLGTDHPVFKDLIFALSVSCALCGKFISENIKDLAAKEVELNKRKKTMEDPNWIPRNWENLRDVVQKSWE